MPELVRQRASSNGVVGGRWLRGLPEVVGGHAARWGLRLDQAFVGGTAGYVVAARDAAGLDVVVKVAMPLDAEEVAGFRRSRLLERLGPNLDEIGMARRRLVATVATTLRTFWRPIADEVDLPTGADKAAWLARDRLERLHPRTIAAFDRSRAVLVHGDAHGWNTLDAGRGQFKFVDPEGVRSEPAHDLGVPMREYDGPLLSGDTARLVRERAEQLGSWCC